MKVLWRHGSRRGNGKWQGWEVLREWTAKLLEVGVGFGKENQRMKNHANYFEKPWPS